MRVGLMIYGSLDTLSGGYLYDRRLVDHLRQQGDTVEVISQSWKNYPAHLLQNFDREMIARLERLEIDLLLQDEINHPSLFWMNRRLAGRLAAPRAAVVHHLRSSEQHPAGLRLIYRAVERAYLQTLDAFIYNSRTTRASVESLLGRQRPCVVATPGGDELGGGLLPVSPTKKPGDPLRVLFVGNLIERKGLHTLLAAVALPQARGCELSIVGREDVDPGYTTRVQKLAEKCGGRVRFLGRLTGPALRQAYRESDILAVPSSYEGFGIVYLEGMAAGLPALATTAGAAAEIIEDGKSGFLVPPENPRILADRLVRLANDPRRLAEMQSEARRRYRQFPTWEESMAQVRHFLLGLTRPASK